MGTSVLYELVAETHGDRTITVLLQMIVVNMILKTVQKPVFKMLLRLSSEPW